MDDNRNRDDGRSVGTAGMRGPEGTRSGVAEGLFEESLGRLRGIGWAQSQDRGKLPDLGMLIQSSDISHKSQFNLRFAGNRIPGSAEPDRGKRDSTNTLQLHAKTGLCLFTPNHPHFACSSPAAASTALSAGRTQADREDQAAPWVPEH